MNTSGFYKCENQQYLLYAENSVINKDYQLYREEHETYTYPVDDWYWFNTEEEAKAFFNIKDEEVV